MLLGSLVAFGPLSMELYLPGLPSLSRDLSTSASLAQLTITACMAGLGAGQLLIGPISDALGRRKPLIVGLVLYALASLLCALAPNIWVLLGMRFLQGMAGSAGIVIARAMVRDLATGHEAARLYAMLMLVTGLAPMLAPILGGELLHITDWRGLFVVLAGIGVALLALAVLRLPETLLASRRHVGGTATSREAIRVLLHDRSFLALTLCVGLAFSTLTAYLGGAAFVLEDIHGLSPQAFGLIVGINAAGMVGAAQLSGRLVYRVGPERLLHIGLAIGSVAGVILVVVVLGNGGLVLLLPALFLIIATRGLVTPNAQALALSEHPESAGTASGILGTVQFGLGAITAPLAGVAGANNALPMALTVAATSIGAFVVLVLRARRHGPVLRV